MVKTSENAAPNPPSFIPYLCSHCKSKKKIKTVEVYIIIKKKLSNLKHTIQNGKHTTPLRPNNLVSQTLQFTKGPKLTRITVAITFIECVRFGGPMLNTLWVSSHYLMTIL